MRLAPRPGVRLGAVTLGPHGTYQLPRVRVALDPGLRQIQRGWLAARNECRHQKQAITGIICGVIGLCTYLLR